MKCRCGSSDTEMSSTVIGFDKNTLTASVSVAITCANCYRLLASGNAVVTLNPIYHNFKYPAAVEARLGLVRGEDDTITNLRIGPGRVAHHT